ncbi:hypothetical protein C7S18_08325 [Ahniella affigens]|uniref:TniQ family protein n=1 Tax=Ahniella affigens TaxID=2021234 RepID=A0A2P1PQS9_9GAMM|nr:hypothetical protein [Ahniella affigens]AVP97200.1 hypothetical protein C7S18_08325 [Ahniella affigens]
MSMVLTRDCVHRLPIAPPAPDETISSVLDRAACLMGTSREALLAAIELPDAGDGRDLDDALLPLAAEIARALCWDREWHPPAPPVPTRRLAASARNAFCAHCWVEDLATARGTYFRTTWLDAMVPWCARHQTPLDTMLSRYPERRRTILVASEAATAEHRKEAESLRNRLDGSVDGAAQEAARIACELGRHLPLHDEPVPPWPNGWRGNAALAQLLLKTALDRLSVGTDLPVHAVLWPDAGAGRWGGVFRVGKAIGRSVRADGLGPHFCAIADPAVRRAALYFVALALVPNTPLPAFYRLAGHVAAAHHDWWHRVIWPSLLGGQADDLVYAVSSLGDCGADWAAARTPPTAISSLRPKRRSPESVAPDRHRLPRNWVRHWRPLLANRRDFP